MKKNLLFTLLITFSMFLLSCGSDNSSDTDYEDEDNIEVTTNDSDYDDVSDNDVNEIDDYIFEYTGSYESKTGVMTDISCYCFQVGYFTTDGGEEIVICFADGMEEASCSENLKIVGYFETVSINPDENSPCSSGDRELFHVTEFECL